MVARDTLVVAWHTPVVAWDTPVVGMLAQEGSHTLAAPPLVE